MSAVGHALGIAVAVAIGAVVVFAGCFLLLGMARSFREGERLRRTGAPSFIGGLRYHATGGMNSGMQSNATWPYARLDVGVDQVTISLNKDIGFLMRAIRPDTIPPRSLRSDEVREVETNFGPSFSKGFRFRTLDPADERDGTVFWATGEDRERIVRQLAAAGFHLAK